MKPVIALIIAILILPLLAWAWPHFAGALPPTEGLLFVIAAILLGGFIERVLV